MLPPDDNELSEKNVVFIISIILFSKAKIVPPPKSTLLFIN